VNKNNRWKILQIIAAPAGWKAVHCQPSENEQVNIFNRPIICWALVEVAGGDDALRTEVRGVEQQSNHLAVVDDLIMTETTGEYSADGNQYFLGYDGPEAHKESDYWIKQANMRHQTVNGERSSKEIANCASSPNDSQS